jgi:hypothetical protein
MSKAKFISRNKVLDNMHSGGRLCQMYTARDGMQWFTIGINAGPVNAIDAIYITNLPNVIASKDALFPNMSQTYRLITCDEVA